MNCNPIESNKNEIYEKKLKGIDLIGSLLNHYYCIKEKIICLEKKKSREREKPLVHLI